MSFEDEQTEQVPERLKFSEGMVAASTQCNEDGPAPWLSPVRDPHKPSPGL